MEINWEIKKRKVLEDANAFAEFLPSDLIIQPVTLISWPLCSLILYLPGSEPLKEE